jgi:hypothetical protein
MTSGAGSGARDLTLVRADSYNAEGVSERSTSGETAACGFAVTDLFSDDRAHAEVRR